MLSITCLGPGALFVPIVVMNAPLGILGCFQKITVQPTPDQTALMVIIHAVFWTLLFTGLAARNSLPPKWLCMIWWILVVALIMSVTGCAIQIGPGLRNEGNWH